MVCCPAKCPRQSSDEHRNDDVNLYAYVGNDPLNAIDPSGRACIWLNSGSPYCERAGKYAQIDGAVMAQTRFFAAASATVLSLASLDLPGSGQFVSAGTKHFMSSLSGRLEGLNGRIARDIQSGALRGAGLDSRIVHMEQSVVQSALEDFKAADAQAYRSTVSQVNDLLNGRVAGLSGNVLATDRAYNRVLEGVRSELGRNIDFENQSDREAIGNAVIDHIRKSGGCDVTGSRIKSC